MVGSERGLEEFVIVSSFVCVQEIHTLRSSRSSLQLRNILETFPDKTQTMKTAISIRSSLIAPCGMNCGICMAYLREKKNCPGCRGSNDNKSFSCRNCRIKNCDELKKHNMTFCHECEKLPCVRLRTLDKRYRTKYNMSMIENLKNISALGIRKFVKNEKVRWTCLKCGGIICVHRGFCFSCGEQS